MAGGSRKQLGKNIRWHRRKAGISQVELASKVHAANQTVSAYETGRRLPDRETIERIDAALSAGGSLIQSWDEVTDEREIPDEWLKFDLVEQDASAICEYRGDAIPGLLQIPEYAGAIIQNIGHRKEVDLEKLVKSRTARISKLNGTELSFVLDEWAVSRTVGSREIQGKQLEHLHSLAETRRIRLGVVPLFSPQHPNPVGPFRIMTLRDGRLVGHEDYRSGVHVVTGKDANRLVSVFSHLQNEALPASQTLELLEKTRQQVNGY